MLDSLPDEWKEKLDAMPSRKKYTDEELQRIDALIIAYYPAKSFTQLEAVCGMPRRTLWERYDKLRKDGRTA
jgi:hypothetical protein